MLSFLFYLFSTFIISLFLYLILQIIDGYPLYDLFPSIFRSIGYMFAENRWHVTNKEFYIISGFILFIIFLTPIFYLFIRKKSNLYERIIGFIFPLLILLLITIGFAPAITHLASLPLIFILISIGIILINSKSAISSWLFKWLEVLIILTPILLIWVPALYLLILGSGTGYLFVIVAGIVLLNNIILTQFDFMLKKDIK